MRMDQNVLYRGQRLTLTRFWATGEPCLWITDPEQIGMPKMELNKIAARWPAKAVTQFFFS